MEASSNSRSKKRRRGRPSKISQAGAQAIRLITRDIRLQETSLEAQKIRGRIPGLRDAVRYTFSGEVTSEKVDALVEWCNRGALRSYVIRAAAKVRSIAEDQAETDRLLEEVSDEDLDTVPPITSKVRDAHEA